MRVQFEHIGNSHGIPGILIDSLHDPGCSPHRQYLRCTQAMRVISSSNYHQAINVSSDRMKSHQIPSFEYPCFSPLSLSMICRISAWRLHCVDCIRWTVDERTKSRPGMVNGENEVDARRSWCVVVVVLLYWVTVGIDSVFVVSFLLFCSVLLCKKRR